MPSPWSRRAAMLLGLAIVVSCGSDGPTEPPTVITSVAITTPHPLLGSLGDSTVLAVHVENSKHEVVSDADVTWMSSTPSVATVNHGVVVAKGNGTTIITASLSGHSDTTTVTVFTVKSLAISPARPTLTALGDSATLVAAPMDASGSAVQDVTTSWESSAPAVATVDHGVIVAKGNGTTIITAHVGELVDTTTVTVTQQPAQLAFLTRPASQLQGHVFDAPVDVAVSDSRGVRLAIPSAPIQLSVSTGTLGGTTSRSAAAGVASFDDLVATEPTRAARLTARLGTLQATGVFFEVQLALASVSAGGVHTCGLTAAGRAYCWGYAGRTGDGGTTARTTPVRVSGSDTYHSLDAGSSYTMAFNQSGDIVMWDSIPAPFPTAVKFTRIASFWFPCGITSGQVAYCWATPPAFYGNDTATYAPLDSVPKVAMGSRPVLAITAGISYTCAIMAADSTAWCAGNNVHGELGNGTTSSTNVPVAVAGGLKFRSISAGNEYACGITIGGETYCWGRNDQGQLGDPAETGAQSALPRLVAGGHLFRSISAGGTATCGLTDDGSAYCWGNNTYGILGSNGAPSFSASPLAVSGNLKFDVVSVGGWHACGIAKTGYTYCWGDWSNGATGTGSANTNNGPAVIASPSP